MSSLQSIAKQFGVPVWGAALIIFMIGFVFGGGLARTIEFLSSTGLFH
ncbi:MAG: hypothetical protein AAGJ87_01525 [Pseudomonadota bacterium]